MYTHDHTTKGEKLTLVTVEISQVLEKLVSVAHQDVHYRAGLVGIGNKNLRETQIASTPLQEQNLAWKFTIIATRCLVHLRHHDAAAKALPASMTNYLPNDGERPTLCAQRVQKVLPEPINLISMS